MNEEPKGIPEEAFRLTNKENTVGELDWTQIEPEDCFTKDTQSVLMDVGYLLDFAEAVRTNQPGEFAMVHLCVTDGWPVMAVPVEPHPDVAYSVAPRVRPYESPYESPAAELREEASEATDDDVRGAYDDSETGGDRMGDVRELAGHLNANGCEDGAALIKEYAERFW